MWNVQGLLYHKFTAYSGSVMDTAKAANLWLSFSDFGKLDVNTFILALLFTKKQI